MEYRCPSDSNPGDLDEDDPQKCPDPTDASKNEYHTDFRLDADGEQIYLFDRLDNGLGLIHGYKFAPVGEPEEDSAYTLCPDGDPNGTFVLQRGTPREPNRCGPVFRRSDANGDCTVNIADPVFHLASLFQGGEEPPCDDAADANDDGTLNIADPVFVLNYLFASGPAPNAPGPVSSGPDPTDDVLSCNTSSRCP